MTVLKHTILLITLFIFSACQKQEKAEYDNSFIKNADQLIKDIDAQDNEKLKETIKGFDENSRFTQEFAYIYQDRQLLAEVISLVKEGKTQEAEQAIDDHISIRGLSPEIKETQAKLKAANAIVKYEENKPYESVSKAKGSLLKAQTLSQDHFSKLPHYKAWSIGENRLIKRLQKKEDLLVEKSLELHYDIASVSDRRILDLIQVQIYSLENSETRNDWTNYLETGKSLNKNFFQTGAYLLNSRLAEKEKNTFMQQDSSSFREELRKIEVYAKEGKTAQFIESITELNKDLAIDKIYLQELFKNFLLNKGWYKSSNSNKPYLDLSTLLQMTHKAL